MNFEYKKERKMHFEGVAIGLLVFVIIGVFHPMVIKTEYYYGKNVWPIYFIIGWLFVGFSIWGLQGGGS